MSTAAIPVHIALVDATGRISGDEMTEVVGALNEQVLTDFVPYWHVKASVGFYTSPPQGTWQVVIQAKLDDPSALGYHTDDTHNQPISYCSDEGDWTVTVSHELLEMLADPFGNRMHSARLPRGVEMDYEHFKLKQQSSRVHYLVEVCDPCETTSYEVGGVKVSDFLLPTWYRTSDLASGGIYSRVGGCVAPRDVADGGYVSFCNDQGDWYQVFADMGLHVHDLGSFDRQRFSSLREFADSKAREHRTQA